MGYILYIVGKYILYYIYFGGSSRPTWLGLNAGVLFEFSSFPFENS